VQRQRYNFAISWIKFFLECKVGETCQIFNNGFIDVFIMRDSQCLGAAEYDSAIKNRINAVFYCG
jgi:hypothetical protein